MKLDVEINNLAGARIRKDFLRNAIRETLNASGYDFLRKKSVSVSVAIVPPAEIKKLNKAYRKKNAVTDVLSFAEHKNRAALEKIRDKDIFLGELILCYNDIAEYARKNNLKVTQELSKVVSHGLLHLLGFSHGRKMFALQDAVSGNATRPAPAKKN